jgi:hypothetical protein
MTTVSTDEDGGDVSAPAFSWRTGEEELVCAALPEPAAKLAGRHKDAATSAASERRGKFIANVPSDLLVV